MKSLKLILTCCLFSTFAISTFAQEESVAHKWNEALLSAIRNDFARPTVHARNLWHTSIAMYDAWAAYDTISAPYFLGNTVGNYTTNFNGVDFPEDIEAAREEAMSYAAYRLLKHRFQFSPGGEESLALFDDLMIELGYDLVYANTDYENEPPAALGNYIADNLIQFGLNDGSNEQADYANQYYVPVNDPLDMTLPGNPSIEDPNRWQPLELPEFIDQGGNPFTVTPPFLSPEWGNVVPFALDDSVKTVYERDGDEYIVYHDPASPPQIDTLQEVREYDEAYRWGFEMVSVWSSHNSPDDGVIWDISPASIGNVQWYPESYDEYPEFYDFENGGDNGQGHDINPYTGLPYEPQYVPRGDYARILAEFWADGPDSETPPGHWFTILNTVSSNPLLEKRWNGTGPILSDLEWDVKCYFTLSGAMHDAAIAAWGVKGYYDFIRPVSAIRFMAEKGQSSDENLPSFHPGGIQLIDGLIELVEEGDALAGDNNENLGKIKLFTWRGPDYIEDPATDDAGVGWILADNWWPYQRPTFVTPPFAGYVSGHSTYSRAAAEVMELMTGDAFFPGGMGEFHAPINEFLVFEEGPSFDVTLQWATYRDASDQCSLSRIWGGIHPPCDDIPGRKMGAEIGVNAYVHALDYLEAGLPRVVEFAMSDDVISQTDIGMTLTAGFKFDRAMNTTISPELAFTAQVPTSAIDLQTTTWISSDSLEIAWTILETSDLFNSVSIELSNGVAEDELTMADFTANHIFTVDMVSPVLVDDFINPVLLTENEVGSTFSITLEFNEVMNQDVQPTVTLPTEVANSFLAIPEEDEWVTSKKWKAHFELLDDNIELPSFDLLVNLGQDLSENPMAEQSWTVPVEIDTRAPEVSFVLITENEYVWENETYTDEIIELVVIFDEEMQTEQDLEIELNNEDPSGLIELQSAQSGWISSTNYVFTYAPLMVDGTALDIDVFLSNGFDANGNEMETSESLDLFSIDFLLNLVEIDQNASFSLFPNLINAGELVQISLENAADNQTDLNLFSSEGKLIGTERISSGTQRTQINTNLSPGAYFVVITNSEGTPTARKLIVR